MKFTARLEASCRNRNSLLCIGLDPRVAGVEGKAACDRIVEANRRIVGETSEYAAAFKPNIAFYEAHGGAGWDALLTTFDLIPKEIPIIVDAKRSDIGSTAEAYASSIFGMLEADAVTLSPYLGRDGIQPFLDYDDCGVFVLCRTTNPSAGSVQDLNLAGKGPGNGNGSQGNPLYLRIASEAASWGSQVGLVVAGNDSVSLERVRELLPEIWFLSPGLGTQGGTPDDAVGAGIRADGLGMLLNVSRSVASAPSPGAEARNLRDAINAAREAADLGKRESSRRSRELAVREDLLRGIVEFECFQLGDFTLKSGKSSPFYIDLRRLASNPELLRTAARAYATLLNGIECDRIAGIPMAALPLATALSLETGVPMIYPRLDRKDHGTGNLIDGDFQEGQRVVLIDDVITTGGAKLEAAEILRSKGLIVSELIVLLERGVQGRRDLDKAGIELHAYAHVRELLTQCVRLGRIDRAEMERLAAFVDNT